jgi:hypothetical protein
MELAAESKARLDPSANSSEIPAAEPTEEERAATQVAETVLAADPATGSVDVVYVGPNHDVADRRFLLVLFGGERTFLFDRDRGRTAIVELDDRRLTGDARLEPKLENACAATGRPTYARL